MSLLFRILRSMLELANQTISESQIHELIAKMYASAGFKSRDELTLSDFLKILGDYRDEFGFMELNLDGELSKMHTNIPAQNIQVLIFRSEWLQRSRREEAKQTTECVLES